ncbi:MAG: DUF58 domain-containing protein [Candidatus Limimorpha sp.]|nr:DUF58 domain-containing protein [Bacteroidales bacterium]MCI7377139.1 DUF58 domain-containing protein [Bacteroidales bacterium]MDD5978199.1 DUF58 domain-containing protein [Bacteroidales bacterium]MDD7277025.1 DUF58 domain-containing protein [Bacteroidales bacterium]MDY6074863.1 DUF58 domain-containing protein [Bacteroidales bacterium]
MEATELFKKVRKIEIKTRGLTNHIFSGQYHSAFKGRGMTFSEVREYQYGDDVRNIDWNVTARFHRPFVKIFEEEREMTVMLLIDVSSSNDFGSSEATKRDITAEIAAVLAFSAIQNNDKVGVIFFSDRVEKFIPPKKGSSHILRIIREIVSFKPQYNGTDIGEGLKFLTSAIKKRTTAFLISDFMTSKSFEQEMRIAARKHDLISLRITDKRELILPKIGLLKFRDNETNKEFWVDTSTSSWNEAYQKYVHNETQRLNKIFANNGIDNTLIYTDEDYVKPLMQLFKRRESRK